MAPIVLKQHCSSLLLESGAPTGVLMGKCGVNKLVEYRNKLVQTVWVPRYYFTIKLGLRTAVPVSGRGGCM